MIKARLSPFFLTLIFATLCLSCLGQKVDLNRLQEQIDSLYPERIDESFVYVKKGLPDAIAYGDSLQKTFFLDIAGEIYRIKGDYDSAIFCLDKSLSYKTHWTDLKDLSLSHNDIGKTYVNMGEYDKAAYHFIEALKLMEQDGNRLGQSFYLNNLGILYDLQQNYLKAIEYYEKSLAIKEELGDTNAMGAANLNLGILYYNLEDYQSSVDYLESSLEIYRDHSSVDKSARAMCNLILTYIANGSLENAGDIKEELENLYPEIVEEMLRVRALTSIARYYLSAGDFSSAQRKANQALKLAYEIEYFVSIRDLHMLKSDLYEDQNQLDSSLMSLKLAMAYKDSLIDEKNIASVAEMESKYQHEKNKRLIKEKEIAQLKSKKKYEKQLQQKKLNLLYLSLISSILISVLIILFVRYRNKRKKNELLMVQNALIDKRNKDLSQINEVISTEIDGLKLSLEEKNKLLENVIHKGTKKELSPELVSLSKREMEVLCNLSLGYSDEELAETLHVSKSTVKTHLRRIYSKLLVKGRAEAIVIAHKYGLMGQD